MSEMKPIAWAIPHHMPNDTYPHCELVLYRKQAAQNTLALYTADQLAEAVAAERERNDATIRSLATGYERMSRALCNMTATSGPDASWYRHQADQALYSVPAIWDIAKNPVEAQPGECLWVNREGSLEAIRSAAK